MTVAGTAGIHVARSRSTNPNTVSASGLGARIVRAPSKSAPCTPGQASGKVWAMGTERRIAPSRSRSVAAAKTSEL